MYVIYVPTHIALGAVTSDFLMQKEDAVAVLAQGTSTPPLPQIMSNQIRESLIKYDPPMQAEAAREKIKKAQAA